eukprot:jgi/Astpho2/3655/e_gw1.00059.3.1_t
MQPDILHPSQPATLPVILQSGAGATLPMFSLIFGQLINAVGQNLNNLPRLVSEVCLYFVYLSIVGLVAGYFEVAPWMWSGTRQANRIRHRYLAAVLRQDVAFFDEKASGGLMQGLNEDIVAIQNASEKNGNFMHHLATFVVGYIIAFTKGWDMTLVILALTPLLALAGTSIALALGRMDTASSKAYAAANGIATEALAAVRTVLSFNGEQRTLERYRASLQKPMQTGILSGALSGCTLGTANLIFMCSYALALWYGGVRVRAGKYTGGSVLTVLFAALIGGFALGQAAPNVQFFATGRPAAAAARVFAIIGRQPIIADPKPRSQTGGTAQSKNTEPPASCRGAVEFRSVTFAYPARSDVPVFRDFSLTVPAGSTVALVGESGSGKSTVVSLTERFYDPLAGQASVLLDGRDLRDLPLSWLRQQMGLVSQEPTLFATTIYQNILFGKPSASRAEVEAAAAAANAHKFISALPKGYETLVGERGVQMSGGQKQRIAIARAILRNPPLLLLDEATSALDSQSERIVQQALDNLMAGRTTIVVAHRLSTIQNADMIAVVRAGAIVESGSHGELMARPNGAYATLVKLQAIVHQKDQEVCPPHTSIGMSSAGAPRPLPVQEAAPVTTEQTTGPPSFQFKVKEMLAENPLTAAPEPGKAKEKDAPVKAGYGRLLALNRKEWPFAITGCIGSLGLGVLMPGFALALSHIITVYFNPNFHEMETTITRWCIVFAALGAVAFICAIVQSASFSAMGQKLARRLRVMLMAALFKQEVSWFDREENSSGAVAGRLATDTVHIRGAVGDALGLIVQNLVTIIAAYVIAFISGWKMTLVVTAVVPLLGLAAYINTKFMGGFSSEADKLFSTANQTASEAVSSIRTVAAFGMQDQIARLYELQLSAPTKKIERSAQVSGVSFGFSQFTFFAVYALGFWYGGKLVGAGEMSFTDMMQVFLAIVLGAMGASQAQMAFPDVARAGGAIQSVFGVIDRKPQQPQLLGGKGSEPDVRGTIELRGVTFRYHTRPEVTVFSDFDLRVEAGKTLALVGQSGSGKSTVISLLEGFYFPEQGQVCIDGCDIATMDRHFLRDQIGLVSQEPVLFSCSIAANILYGRPGATQADMEQAARQANAHEFITRLPEGYETQVGEGGIQLSGGQKQRVAIARAIIKNPKILGLDEATAALDAESEALVQQALERMMVGRTSIVVAHRLSTIIRADSIAVIQQGKIVEQGTYQQLMTKNGAFASLVRHQQQR